MDSVVVADDGVDVDVTRTMYFAFPDDRNVDDRTVMVVLLPNPVAQGETVRLDMKWRAKIPRTFARTGYRGNYYFLAHWFPKLGVYEAEGWNCHQFHAGTEFYSDYGVYDVSMTVPEAFVVGATGRESARQANNDGTVTHRYVQEDVHAFTWTASPDYVVVEDRFEHESLPPVDIRLLHAARAHGSGGAPPGGDEGRLRALRQLVRALSLRPRHGGRSGLRQRRRRHGVPDALHRRHAALQSRSGAATRRGSRSTRPGISSGTASWATTSSSTRGSTRGSTPFRPAARRFVAFGEPLYTQRFFQPPGLETSGFFALLLPGFDHGGVPHLERVGRYRPDATSDPQSAPSYRYHPDTGGSLSYSKTALWLATLENWLGWERSPDDPLDLLRALAVRAIPRRRTSWRSPTRRPRPTSRAFCAR